MTKKSNRRDEVSFRREDGGTRKNKKRVNAKTALA